MGKMNNVTNTDIELLIKSGEDVAARALDFSNRIFHGKVDPLNDPITKAVDLLATSRTLADLAARICNASAKMVEEQANSYEQTLRARHEKSL